LGTRIHVGLYLVHEQRFADKLGIHLVETSAKTATNVESAFLTMAKELIKSRYACILMQCRCSLGLMLTLAVAAETKMDLRTRLTPWT